MTCPMCATGGGPPDGQRARLGKCSPGAAGRSAAGSLSLWMLSARCTSILVQPPKSASPLFSTAIASESQYARIAELVHNAEANKALLQRLATDMRGGSPRSSSLSAPLRGGGVAIRVAPRDDEQFVSSLVASGSAVLMVGDGINDAPALSRRSPRSHARGDSLQSPKDEDRPAEHPGRTRPQCRCDGGRVRRTTAARYWCGTSGGHRRGRHTERAAHQS